MSDETSKSGAQAQTTSTMSGNNAGQNSDLLLKGRLTKNGMTYGVDRVISRSVASDRLVTEKMRETGMRVTRQGVRGAVVQMFKDAEPLFLELRAQRVELFRILWFLKRSCTWAATMDKWLFSDFFVSLIEARRRWELAPRVYELQHTMPMTNAIVAFRRAVGDGLQAYNPRVSYEEKEIPSWILTEYTVQRRRMTTPVVCPRGLRPVRHMGMSRAYRLEGDNKTYYDFATVQIRPRY
ncbi:hypothetical protein GGR57DRAFT_503801 [Xylariaceae sp. FL1272]|nr:hypothetical protein GGR57DRAFT_503801 [Xylariaceae sp. FL1272]